MRWLNAIPLRRTVGVLRLAGDQSETVVLDERYKINLLAVQDSGPAVILSVGDDKELRSCDPTPTNQQLPRCTR